MGLQRNLSEVSVYVYRWAIKVTVPSKAHNNIIVFLKSGGISTIQQIFGGVSPCEEIIKS